LREPTWDALDNSVVVGHRLSPDVDLAEVALGQVLDRVHVQDHEGRSSFVRWRRDQVAAVENTYPDDPRSLTRTEACSPATTRVALTDW
jgi:hypothetical protein